MPHPRPRIYTRHTQNTSTCFPTPSRLFSRSPSSRSRTDLRSSPPPACAMPHPRPSHLFRWESVSTTLPPLVTPRLVPDTSAQPPEDSRQKISDVARLLHDDGRVRFGGRLRVRVHVD